MVGKDRKQPHLLGPVCFLGTAVLAGKCRQHEQQGLCKVISACALHERQSLSACCLRLFRQAAQRHRTWYCCPCRSPQSPYCCCCCCWQAVLQAAWGAREPHPVRPGGTHGQRHWAVAGDSQGEGREPPACNISVVRKRGSAARWILNVCMGCLCHFCHLSGGRMRTK